MIAGGSTDGDSRRANRAHARAVRVVMEIDQMTPAEKAPIQFGSAHVQGVHIPTMTPW